MSSKHTQRKSKQKLQQDVLNVKESSSKQSLEIVSSSDVKAVPTGKQRKAKKKKKFHFRSWFIGQARRIYRRYPPFYQVRDRVKEVYYITSKSGKPMKRVRFECELCHNKVGNKEIRVDHIDPILAISGFPLNSDGSDNWNAYLPRLFCDIRNLQCICTTCHDAKTNKEKQERKALTSKQ